MPVRPSDKNAPEPPPRLQRQADEGVAEGPEESECSAADIASPTSVAEGDVGDVREVETDDDMDGFIDKDMIIEIEQKDDMMKIKPKQDNLDPVECFIENSRIPRALNAPIKPSAEEVCKHCITHIPYRNWCRICVESKGKEDPHPRGANSKSEEDKTGIPIVSLDYNALEKSEVMTIVGKDESTGMPFQHRVEHKGIAYEWVAKRIIKDLEDIGRRDVILKTDGEPAIVALQSKIIEGRVGRTIPRNPPVYNPEANGPCEKAVQDVTGHTRTLKLALEARLKYTIPMDAPVMEWIIEHAAFILGRYEVGHDGMTSYERLTGRKWRRPMVEFGEVVWAKLVTKVRSKGKMKRQKRKMMKRSLPGVWVGQMVRTGEHIVILENGDAMRCRTVRRVPEDERWDVDKIFAIVGTPKLPAPSQRNPHSIDSRQADQGPTAKAPSAPREEQPGREYPAMPKGREREVDIRELRITDNILEKFGGPNTYTPGCHGCDYRQQGRTHRRHSKECRQRIYEEMKTSAEGRALLEVKDERMKRKAELIGASRGGDEVVREEENEPNNEPVPATPRFGNDENEENVQDESVVPQLDSDCELFKRADDEPDVEMDESNSTKRDADEAQTDLPPSSDNEGEPSRSKRQRIQNVTGNTLDKARVSIIDITPKRFSENSPWAPSGVCRLTFQNGTCLNEGQLTTTVGKDLARVEFDKEGSMNLGREVERLTGQLRSLQKTSEVKEIMRQLDKLPKFKMDVPKRKRLPMEPHGNMDVAEIYSPPRITEVAAEMGLEAGWALDLTTVDEHDGKPWDFTFEEKRIRCKKRIDEDKPFMVIASPMCGPFSSLQNWNYAKMDKKEVKDRIEKGLEHIKFCLDICLKQHLAGRLFLFEHPAGASSWWSQMIEQIATLEGIYKTTFDFCTLGMETAKKPGDKTAPAKKRTRVLTNSHAIHTLLREAQCRGDHWHMVLLDGRAGPCQEYPKKFSRLICEGIKRELDTVKWKKELHEIFDISQPFGKLMQLQAKMDELPVPPEEDPFDKLYNDCDFYDDISGAYLDKELAVKARKLEMEFFKKMGVYTKVKREAWMKVITTKWLDVNKGDGENPNVRARLVGRELKMDKRDDLFAATPPLESLKAILAICASKQFRIERSERFVVMSTDVKRAYFHAPATRPIFIEIPTEDRQPGH